MATRWITKKGRDGENRHIPINEGNGRRERELNIKKQKYEERTEKMNTIKTLYQLGLITDQWDLNITEKELNEFFNQTIDANGDIKSSDEFVNNLLKVWDNDMIELVSINSDHDIVIEKILSKYYAPSLKAGKYEIYYDKSEDTFKLKKIDPYDTRRDPFMPNSRAVYDGLILNIDGEKYKKMKTILNDLDKETQNIPVIAITKDKGSDKVKMKFYKGVPKNYTSKDLDNYYVTEIEFDAPPEKKDAELFSYANAQKINRALTMLNGKSENGDIKLSLKSHYPLLLYKGNIFEGDPIQKMGHVDPMVFI